MKFLNQKLVGSYGSRRGFVKTISHQLKYYASGYGTLKNVDWSTIGRVVFVCKGNICRSAFSEVLAAGLGMTAVSCGVDTQKGFPADKDAVRIAAERGVDLSAHATTPIQALEVMPGDLFVAMEPWHIERIRKLRGDSCRCTLLGLWMDPVKPYIHDPYGTCDQYFHHCFDYLEKAVNEISKKISVRQAAD